MNRIELHLEKQARELFLAGGTVRVVSREIGIAPMTGWRIQREVRREHGVIYCQCGKTAGHKGWCSQRGLPPWHSQLLDISRLNIYIPQRPRYERPQIANERETEIALLVNSRMIKSLDAPVFDLENSHTLIKSDAMTPLEILLMKEEMQSEEYQSRKRRIDEWNRFVFRKTSAFQNRPVVQ